MHAAAMHGVLTYAAGQAATAVPGQAVGTADCAHTYERGYSVSGVNRMLKEGGRVGLRRRHEQARNDAAPTYSWPRSHTSHCTPGSRVRATSTQLRQGCGEKGIAHFAVRRRKRSMAHAELG